ncbi:MAG: fibronectin type III domain-containing protein [Lachnospiraceae bacterium]|nr:fibronectin type III domain-containing protein [Lachnospiraceae bacterium]
MRKLFKQLSAVVMAVAVTVAAVPSVQAAEKIENMVKGPLVGWFGENEDWHDCGTDGVLTANGIDYSVELKSIGYGGIWGGQVKTEEISVTPGASYTLSGSLFSTKIDKWVMIKVAYDTKSLVDGRWVQIKAGQKAAYSFTFTVPTGVSSIQIVYGMGGVQPSSSGQWDVDELEELYGAEVHDDIDAQYDTTIAGSDINLVPVNTTLKSVKAAKKSAKVTVNMLNNFKQKDVKKYRIQYSKKANFKGAKKVDTAKKTVKIKKLQSKKKYYFRVAVVNKNGKVGPWSKAKSVKVK